ALRPQRPCGQRAAASKRPLSGRHSNRQFARHHRAGTRGARRRRPHRMRGHARDPQASRPFWHHHPAHALSRAQCRRGAAEAHRPAHRGCRDRVGLGRRDAARLRPRYKLVRDARAAGASVTTLPGASAVLAALTLSGLPTDRFLFEGFLPAKDGARRARINELKRIPATLILFDTGARIATTLADLAAELGPRQAAICRELTKLYEEVKRGDLGTLAREAATAEEPRGEIVIVV